VLYLTLGFSTKATPTSDRSYGISIFFSRATACFPPRCAAGSVPPALPRSLPRGQSQAAFPFESAGGEELRSIFSFARRSPPFFFFLSSRRTGPLARIRGVDPPPLSSRLALFLFDGLIVSDAALFAVTCLRSSIFFTEAASRSLIVCPHLQISGPLSLVTSYREGRL